MTQTRSSITLRSWPFEDGIEFDTYVTKEILNTLQSAGLTIEGATDLYFQGVHWWLPAVDRASFGIPQIGLSGRPSADTAILLLCMYLLCQPFLDSKTQNTLHSQCKTLFASLQIVHNTSLRTIQCGLFLSAYQLGAGLLSDSYVTLSTSVALARVAGLQRCGEISVTGFDERTHTWLCLIVIDRYVLTASDHRKWHPVALIIID